MKQKHLIPSKYSFILILGFYFIKNTFYIHISVTYIPDIFYLHYVSKDFYFSLFRWKELELNIFSLLDLGQGYSEINIKIIVTLI